MNLAKQVSRRGHLQAKGVIGNVFSLLLLINPEEKAWQFSAVTLYCESVSIP